MRVGLVQMCSSDDPGENLVSVSNLIGEAAAKGADFVLTPEVTNCVSASRKRQTEVLTTEDDDRTLAVLRGEASLCNIWLLIGSLALKGEADDRFVNRSFLISPKGEIVARYDKIHMFDVQLSELETYRESDGYRPGEQAVIGHVGDTSVGMTICYDVRFPHLYRDLAQAGAKILTVPSAFSPETGPTHWETLLKARAIETGSFVLAPAQTGTHHASRGRTRRTWGHSLAIDPWGRVLADGGEPEQLVTDQFIVHFQVSVAGQQRMRDQDMVEHDLLAVMDDTEALRRRHRALDKHHRAMRQLAVRRVVDAGGDDPCGYLAFRRIEVSAHHDARLPVIIEHPVDLHARLQRLAAALQHCDVEALGPRRGCLPAERAGFLAGNGCGKGCTQVKVDDMEPSLVRQ